MSRMGPKPKPAHERVLAMATRLSNGCLVVPASSRGYGQIRVGSVKTGDRMMKRSHRVVYEALVGPIPDGLVLDHLCHNADASCPGGDTCPHRACVEVTHLQPKSNRDNLIEGSRAIGHVLRRTNKCANGHDLNDPKVAYTYKDGTRYCRVCRRKP